VSSFAPGRALRWLGVPLLVLVGAGFAWRAYEKPLRAAARDYLALRRVDEHREVLATAAREANVDPYLLAGVMVAESGGRVSVVSKAGAMGLFQLTRTTADWRAQELGLPSPSDEELLSNPTLNARLGADNLAWLLDTYDGDEVRALCAYNAGARKLKELSEAEGGWEAWRALHAERRDSGILAYAERVLSVRDDLRSRGTFERPEASAVEPDAPEAAVPVPEAGSAEPKPAEPTPLEPAPAEPTVEPSAGDGAPPEDPGRAE
jgi:soluble lytic murein transglycosylase-like protein